MGLRETSSTVNERIGQISSANSIEFVKSKYDYFSGCGILVILATGYYLIFDSERFLTNMENPINLIIWIILISYPIIRYWIPFHVYKLNATGIMLKNSEMLSWSDIKTVTIYDNYEEEKDKETPEYRLELTVVTIGNETKKIKFNNYTIADNELRKKIKPYLSKKLKMKDVLVKIFMSFYEKNR